MRIVRTTVLPCRADEAVAHVRTPRLLQFVAAPMVHFEPVDPPAFPEQWADGTYWVRLRLLGIIPFGRQAVVISHWMDDDTFVVRDAGHSALIRQWDHIIRIRPVADGTEYIDDVSVQAGVLTPVVALFAWVFYRHRQQRWRLLAARRFSYPPGSDRAR